MRRLVPLLVLALAAPGCTRDRAPAAVPEPPATRSPEPVRPTAGQVAGGLVYVTDTGVHHLPRQGSPRRIAAARDVRDLAVSAAGRYAVWVSAGNGFTFADVAGDGLREWTSPDVVADSVDVTDDGFVTVDEGETSRVLRFDPDLMLRGGEPELTPLRGITEARLVAAAGERVLVATYGEGGDTVYDVAANGAVTRLFRDDAPLPNARTRRLPIGAAGLTSDGRTLVYGTGIRGTGTDDECTLDYGVAVRDLTTGTAVPMAKAPSLGDDVWTLVHSVTTGPDGRIVAGFGTEMQSCGGQPPRGGAYAVDGGRWTPVARGAHWAATDPDGRFATLSADGVLTVGGRRIATGVRLASWSPS